MSERNRTAEAIESPDEVKSEPGRFGSRFSSRFERPEMVETGSGLLDGSLPLQEQWAAGDRGQFKVRGKILQIWLGHNRDINFGRFGPRLAELQSGQFLIPDPVLDLPTRKMKDRHGREQVVRPKVEQYASRTAAGCYVIEPLCEILYEDLDQGNHWHYLYLGPNATSGMPVLLFQPQAKRLLIYGQGTFRLG